MDIAVIDLGTNSLRLFIYRYNNTKNSFRKVLKLKRMVRLGDNAFNTETLDKSAIKRTIKVFKEFEKVIQQYNPNIVKAVATSAVRSVQDKQEFIDKVKEESNIELEVISGKQEALYIARGVLSKIELPLDNLVFIDIGGGSTEISLVSEKKILTSVSLKLGAGRCQQLFLKNIPPKKEDLDKLKEHINLLLKENFPNNFKASFAIGTSGSIRAFNKIVNNNSLKRQTFNVCDLHKFVEKIETYQKDEFMKLPRLEDERVDLILAAGVVLSEILKYFSIPETYVTSVALKDGILTDYVESLVK